MGDMLGGGGSSGGAVVGGPSPQAAMIAGLYQSNAAQQAAQIAKSSTASAIANLRDQYTAASQTLSPYTTAGYQALDQLNSYLGLGAYSPGTAPVAPSAYAPSKSEILNYFSQNINPTTAGKDSNVYGDYTGIGNAYDGWSQQYAGGPATGQDLVAFLGKGEGDAGNPGLSRSITQAAQNLYDKNPGIVSQVSDYLAQQYNDTNKEAIAAKQAQYEQQKSLYDYAQNLAANHQTMTGDQVQAALAATPGYQAQLNLGLDALNRSAAGKAGLNSGRLLQSLVDYGSGLANQTYQQRLNNLSTVAGMGQQAATQLANNNQNQGNSLASLQSQLGDNLGNAALASGNSLAQSYLAGNQQYKVIGGGSSGGGLGGLGSLLGGAASLGGLFM